MISATPKTVGSVSALVESDLSVVKSIISEQMESGSDCAQAVLHHINSSSGKMLRPAMLLLSGRCFGEPTSLHYETAAIIELIHCVTLIHDDVLDDARIRRGKDSVNQVFGNKTAILAGDMVFAKAFKMCSRLNDPEISSLLAETTIKLCQGEMDQSLNRGNWNMSESEYLDIISQKSASLMSTSCLLGALASGAKEFVSSLAQFGQSIGMAFQVADDILDFTSDEKKLGKPAGNDLDHMTITLPLIHFLSRVQGNRDTAGQQLLELKDRELRISELNGSIEYARSCVSSYYNKAIIALSVLPDSAAKAGLLEVARQIRASAG
jgi:geranylgeranyl pyrophosphate synthase